MKKENKNNYYNEEDKINFEKLNNFKKFKSDNVKNFQIKNYSTSYSNSDKNNFNNILKIEKNEMLLNKPNIEKEISYYNSSDFQQFNQLNNFPEYSNNIGQENNNNTSTKLRYSQSDYGEFDKIVKTKNKNEKTKENRSKKVKVIDFDKLQESENKIKNKLGIEKIKIVYFD